MSHGRSGAFCLTVTRYIACFPCLSVTFPAFPYLSGYPRIQVDHQVKVPKPAKTGDMESLLAEEDQLQHHLVGP